MLSYDLLGAAALLGLSTLTSGHLIMQNPVPYSLDTLNNSPLLNAAPGTAGSDFPCKLRANAFEVTKENMIQVGESNTMTWTGSASHGGGTCQLSVTLDREPTAQSTFKVIASWIGGCPTNATGNDGTIPFQWTMPAEIPNGKATLAWNWVSHTAGQPENYMNCAPVTVSGGASNNDAYNQLEDLFRVNLPSSECGSTPEYNLQIPNPGKYVTTFESTNLMAPTGPACAASGQAQATGDKGSGASATPYASLAAAASTPAPSSAAPAASGAVSLSFPASSAAASSTLATAPSVAASTPAPAAPSAAAGGYGSASPSGSVSSGSDGSSSGSAGGNGSCSTNGAVVCNGETQFGLCNFGKVVWQDVAAGTKCSNGQIQKKRSVEAHIAKHARHPHIRSF